MRVINKELRNIGYDIVINRSFVEIRRFDSTGIEIYIDYIIDGSFSIVKLKEICKDYLEDDKTDWRCSDLVKDNYDLLCTTILFSLKKKIMERY